MKISVHLLAIVALIGKSNFEAKASSLPGSPHSAMLSPPDAGLLEKQRELLNRPPLERNGAVISNRSDPQETQVASFNEPQNLEEAQQEISPLIQEASLTKRFVSRGGTAS